MYLFCWLIGGLVCVGLADKNFDGDFNHRDGYAAHTRNGFTSDINVRNPGSSYSTPPQQVGGSSSQYAAPYPNANDVSGASGSSQHAAPHTFGSSGNGVTFVRGSSQQTATNDASGASGSSQHEAPHTFGSSGNGVTFVRGNSHQTATNDASGASGSSQHEAPHTFGSSGNGVTFGSGSGSSQQTAQPNGNKATLGSFSNKYVAPQHAGATSVGNQYEAPRPVGSTGNGVTSGNVSIQYSAPQQGGSNGKGSSFNGESRQAGSQNTGFHDSDDDDNIGSQQGNRFSNGPQRNGASFNGINGQQNGIINGIATVSTKNGNKKQQQQNGLERGQNGLDDKESELSDIETLTNNIPGGGIPGKDYPILASIPKTPFVCQENGYYADTSEETRCQVYHICQIRGATKQKDSFLCPNGTLFSQKYTVCDWWYNVDCSQSEQFFQINELIGQQSQGGNGSSTGRESNGSNRKGNGSSYSIDDTSKSGSYSGNNGNANKSFSQRNERRIRGNLRY